MNREQIAAMEELFVYTCYALANPPPNSKTGTAQDIKVWKQQARNHYMTDRSFHAAIGNMLAHVAVFIHEEKKRIIADENTRNVGPAWEPTAGLPATGI